MESVIKDVLVALQTPSGERSTEQHTVLESKLFRSCFFSHIPRHICKNLVSLVSYLDFQEESVIERANDRPRYLYILLEGELYVVGGSADETVSGPNFSQVFCSQPVLEDRVSDFTLKAKTRCVFAGFSSRGYREVVGQAAGVVALPREIEFTSPNHDIENIILKAISYVPGYQNYPETLCRDLARWGTLSLFRSGDCLYNASLPPHGVYFILRGAVALHTTVALANKRSGRFTLPTKGQTPSPIRKVEGTPNAAMASPRLATLLSPVLRTARARSLSDVAEMAKHNVGAWLCERHADLGPALGIASAPAVVGQPHLVGQSPHVVAVFTRSDCHVLHVPADVYRRALASVGNLSPPTSSIKKFVREPAEARPFHDMQALYNVMWGFRYFRLMPRELAESLARYAEYLHLEPNSVLIDKTKVVDAVCIVLSGSINVTTNYLAPPPSSKSTSSYPSVVPGALQGLVPPAVVPWLVQGKMPDEEKLKKDDVVVTETLRCGGVFGDPVIHSLCRIRRASTRDGCELLFIRHEDFATAAERYQCNRKNTGEAHLTDEQKKTRLQSLVGSPGALARGLLRPPNSRLDEDLAAIVSYLSSIQFFQQLPLRALRSVAQYLWVTENQMGDIVYREGAVATTMSVVLDGKTTVYKQKGPSEQLMDISSSKKLSPSIGHGRVHREDLANARAAAIEDERQSEYGPRACFLVATDTFGSLALMTHGVRAASVICDTPCTFLTIGGTAFDKFVNPTTYTTDELARHTLTLPPAERSYQGVQSIVNLVKVNAFFTQLPESQLEYVCRAMTIETFDAQEVIFEEGDVGGDCLYILLNGSVSCHKRGFYRPIPRTVFAVGTRRLNLEPTDDLRRLLGRCVSLLYGGDAFGEQSVLVPSTPRGATVVVRERLSAAVLRRAAVEKILSTTNHLAFQPQNAKNLLRIEPSKRTDFDIRSLMAVVEKIPLLRRLPDDVRRCICQVVRLQTYSPGAVIFKQGDLGTAFYAILSGGVNVHKLFQDCDVDEVNAIVGAKTPTTSGSAHEGRRRIKFVEGDGSRTYHQRQNTPMMALTFSALPDKSAHARRLWRICIRKVCRQLRLIRISRATDPYVDTARILRKHIDKEELGEDEVATIDLALLKKKARHESVDWPPKLTATMSVTRTGQSAFPRRSSVSKTPLLATTKVPSENEDPSRPATSDLDIVTQYGVCVATLICGQTFGEIALVSNTPRTATVIARELTEVMLLSREDYDVLIRRTQELELEDRMKFLQGMTLFCDWARNDLASLAYRFETIKFSSNQVLYLEGQPVGAPLADAKSQDTLTSVRLRKPSPMLHFIRKGTIRILYVVRNKEDGEKIRSPGKLPPRHRSWLSSSQSLGAKRASVASSADDAATDTEEDAGSKWMEKNEKLPRLLPQPSSGFSRVHERGDKMDTLPKTMCRTARTPYSPTRRQVSPSKQRSHKTDSDAELEHCHNNSSEKLDASSPKGRDHDYEAKCKPITYRRHHARRVVSSVDHAVPSETGHSSTPRPHPPRRRADDDIPLFGRGMGVFRGGRLVQVAVLGPGDYFGAEAVVGQPSKMTEWIEKYKTELGLHKPDYDFLPPELREVLWNGKPDHKPPRKLRPLPGNKYFVDLRSDRPRPQKGDRKCSYSKAQQDLLTKAEEGGVLWENDCVVVASTDVECLSIPVLSVPGRLGQPVLDQMAWDCFSRATWRRAHARAAFNTFDDVRQKESGRTDTTLAPCVLDVLRKAYQLHVPSFVIPPLPADADEYDAEACAARLASVAGSVDVDVSLARNLIHAQKARTALTEGRVAEALDLLGGLARKERRMEMKTKVVEPAGEEINHHRMIPAIGHIKLSTLKVVDSVGSFDTAPDHVYAQTSFSDFSLQVGSLENVPSAESLHRFNVALEAEQAFPTVVDGGPVGTVRDSIKADSVSRVSATHDQSSDIGAHVSQKANLPDAGENASDVTPARSAPVLATSFSPSQNPAMALANPTDDADVEMHLTDSNHNHTSDADAAASPKRTPIVEPTSLGQNSKCLCASTDNDAEGSAPNMATDLTLRDQLANANDSNTDSSAKNGVSEASETKCVAPRPQLSPIASNSEHEGERGNVLTTLGDDMVEDAGEGVDRVVAEVGSQAAERTVGAGRSEIDCTTDMCDDDSVGMGIKGGKIGVDGVMTAKTASSDIHTAVTLDATSPNDQDHSEYSIECISGMDGESTSIAADIQPESPRKIHKEGGFDNASARVDRCAQLHVDPIASPAPSSEVTEPDDATPASPSTDARIQPIDLSAEENTERGWLAVKRLNNLPTRVHEVISGFHIAEEYLRSSHSVLSAEASLASLAVPIKEHSQVRQTRSLRRPKDMAAASKAVHAPNGATLQDIVCEGQPAADLPLVGRRWDTVLPPKEYTAYAAHAENGDLRKRPVGTRRVAPALSVVDDDECCPTTVETGRDESKLADEVIMPQAETLRKALALLENPPPWSIRLASTQQHRSSLPCSRLLREPTSPEKPPLLALPLREMTTTSAPRYLFSSRTHQPHVLSQLDWAQSSRTQLARFEAEEQGATIQKGDSNEIRKINEDYPKPAMRRQRVARLPAVRKSLYPETLLPWQQSCKLERMKQIWRPSLQDLQMSSGLSGNGESSVSSAFSRRTQCMFDFLDGKEQNPVPKLHMNKLLRADAGVRVSRNVRLVSDIPQPPQTARF